MASDVHYLIIFSLIFLMLALIAPLINEEFNTNYDENDPSEITSDESPNFASFWTIIINLLVLPFYTFGFPLWVNVWILLPLRIPFWFVIGRNLWIGGGG